MSADAQSKSHGRLATTSNTILPQQVTDPTILDSVAGFINDVVLVSYSPPVDTKDQIQWARFESVTNEDGRAFGRSFDCDKILPPPILLVLGYTSGVQVWAVPANGEAVEVLSWKHGSVRILRVLPTPTNRSIDLHAPKRPLIAVCDSVSPGADFCSLCFISLKTGEQVKLIKFKNPILDVVGNKRSVVVTFAERIAVFDAASLEDRVTITTCYLSPGIYANPIALGTKWLAYAENKLIPSKRSSGGNDGEGVQSYTATVLHAAKSLGRGLRELGETVASSLTGTAPHKTSGPGVSGGADVQQKGIVTILDIERPQREPIDKTQSDPVVAHFTAHKEAIVYLSFDPSGLLLLAADKRGYDFHLFRIHPHAGGPALSAVHHLYVLHRGDTTAKVQDMSFSPDSRWVTVSTLRGTTHVFPVTPYGGVVGVRTHTTPHVVNRMSRFHRSAGLTAEGRSNSPVSLFETPVNTNLPFNNPRLPPYPHPTVVHPLAQIRQPLLMQSSGSAQARQGISRQRLGSSSEDNQIQLRVAACFAAPRAWFESPNQSHEFPLAKQHMKPVESLFIMSCHGTLIQYDLEPHHAPSVPKEKVCDDTVIELSVCAKAQWSLQRESGCKDIPLPLSVESLRLLHAEDESRTNGKTSPPEDRWLSQVEIVTHAGPHRRLWMGPQFTFKTYNNATGASVNILDSQQIEMVRSKPVNMPLNTAYPILIESGSVSSCEPSPKLLDTMQRNFDDIGVAGELQLKEDLADAMLESPGIRETGGRCVIVSMKTRNSKVVNPLGTVVTLRSDDESEPEPLEEMIIHENCDESLFRPVVAAAANASVVFDKAKCVRPVARAKPKTDELDSFFDANDACEELDSLQTFCATEKIQTDGLVVADETNAAAWPEQEVGKKARKPKTKLGVRIGGGRKKEADCILDLPQLEPVVEFTAPLPKISYSSILKQAEKEVADGKTSSEQDLLKVEKSSDDEKTSSQTETTESDDSSKTGATGGEQSVSACIYRDTEDLSSTSSFSSASWASPTPSCNGDNLLHFPGDSSSSI